MSEDALKAVTLSAADVPTLQPSPYDDNVAVNRRKYLADTGGPECTLFLNAVNVSGTHYRELDEVDRGYTVSGGPGKGSIQADTMMTGFASAADAQQVVTDARSSAKNCPNVRFTLTLDWETYQDVTVLPLPTVGDDATATQLTYNMRNGTPMPMAVDTIQVGTVVLSVWVYDAPDSSAALQQVATAAAAKLQQEEAWMTH